MSLSCSRSHPRSLLTRSHAQAQARRSHHLILTPHASADAGPSPGPGVSEPYGGDAYADTPGDAAIAARAAK